MDQLKNKTLKDFSRAKSILSNRDLTEKIRITFYRTKPGCFCPPPYQLKYRKLSEVLKK